MVGMNAESIKLTLLTAPYGSDELLDAVEAALDSGNGLLPILEQRVAREQARLAREQAEMDEEFRAWWPTYDGSRQQKVIMCHQPGRGIPTEGLA